MRNPLRDEPKSTKRRKQLQFPRNQPRKLKQSKPNKNRSAQSKILDALAHNPIDNLIWFHVSATVLLLSSNILLFLSNQVTHVTAKTESLHRLSFYRYFA
ncbi:hypothetical protein LguiB_013794 [Lonicera macranthoides]